MEIVVKLLPFRRPHQKHLRKYEFKKQQWIAKQVSITAQEKLLFSPPVCDAGGGRMCKEVGADAGIIIDIKLHVL